MRGGRGRCVARRNASWAIEVTLGDENLELDGTS
jgi:hypothetical protein